MDPAQLKQVPLFANLTADHLQKVAAIATPRILKMGEHIFREGEIGTEMYIIGTGKVRISKMVPGVGEEALAILDPGNYFGEMAEARCDLRGHVGRVEEAFASRSRGLRDPPAQLQRGEHSRGVALAHPFDGEQFPG